MNAVSESQDRDIAVNMDVVWKAGFGYADAPLAQSMNCFLETSSITPANRLYDKDRKRFNDQTFLESSGRRCRQ